MKRALVLLSIVVIGFAAPARSWCEATCTQPAAAHTSIETAKAHCPAHSQGSGTSVAASDRDQCKAIDAARPLTPARLSMPDSLTSATVLLTDLRTLAPSHLRTFAPSHLRTLAPSHPVPLRI